MVLGGGGGGGGGESSTCIKIGGDLQLCCTEWIYSSFSVCGQNENSIK